MMESRSVIQLGKQHGGLPTSKQATIIVSHNYNIITLQLNVFFYFNILEVFNL